MLLLQAKGRGGAETLQWLRGMASGHKEELRYHDDRNRGLNWQTGRVYGLRAVHVSFEYIVAGLHDMA